MFKRQSCHFLYFFFLTAKTFSELKKKKNTKGEQEIWIEGAVRHVGAEIRPARARGRVPNDSLV